MTSPETIFGKSACAAHQVVGGQAVVLHTGDSRMVGLNEVGTFVWQKLDGTRTTRELAEEVARSWPVSSAVALEDTTRMLEKLHARELVEIIR